MTRSLAALALVLLAVPAGAAAAGTGGGAPPPPPPARPAIEIRRPPPPDPIRQAALRAWHAAYDREMAPVRRELAAVLERLARGDFDGLLPRCRRLAAALAEVDAEAMLPVPDFAADVHLNRALSGLSRAATACLADRRGLFLRHLDEAGQAFANAELALRRWGLHP
jgi:hypothetical protein